MLETGVDCPSVRLGIKRLTSKSNEECPGKIGYNGLWFLKLSHASRVQIINQKCNNLLEYHIREIVSVGSSKLLYVGAAIM